jgi:cyclin-dependent kinase 7
MTSLPDYVEYQYSPPQPFRSLFPMASEDCIDLLQRLFTYDPRSRISAQQALEHRYFLTEPVPTKPHLLRRPPPRSEGPPELQSPAEPFVFSPPNKARRVQLFGGDIRTAGEAHQESNPQDFRDQGTPADTIMAPMSSDPNTAHRPTLSSTDRTHLKRKLDMNLALQQTPHG